jgi:hypothetical protein
MRHEALDGRALAASVATFKQHEQALAALFKEACGLINSICSSSSSRS